MLVELVVLGNHGSHGVAIRRAFRDDEHNADGDDDSHCQSARDEQLAARHRGLVMIGGVEGDR